MIEMNKLTAKSQEALQSAARLAEDQKNTQLEPDHLILEILKQENGIVPRTLESFKIPIHTIGEKIKNRVSSFATLKSGVTRVQPSSQFLQIYKGAELEAKSLQDEFISTEHFFLAQVMK